MFLISIALLGILVLSLLLFDDSNKNIAHNFLILNTHKKTNTLSHRYLKPLVKTGTKLSLAVVSVFTIIYLQIFYFNITTENAISYSVFGIIAVLLSFWFIKRHQKLRQAREFNQQIPKVILSLMRIISSGGSILSALEVAKNESDGAMKKKLAEIINKVELGLPFNDILRSASQGFKNDNFLLLLKTMEISYLKGSSFSNSLAIVYDIVKNKEMVSNKLKNMTADTRSSGFIIGVLPLITIISQFVLNHHAFVDSFNSHTFVIVFLSCILAIILGIYFIVKITSIYDE